MARPVFASAALAILLGSASAAADMDAFLGALGGRDPAARAKAFERAAQYGPEAIGPVAELLDHFDPAIVRAAKIALERIVGAATDPIRSAKDARRAASEALCAAAKTVENREGRDWLLWLLSYAGGPEAVPHVADLTDNPEAFDMALFALESIGGKAAIRALEARYDSADDQAERYAIRNALDAIADEESVDFATPEADPEALDGYLRAAEKKSRRAAARMYRRLLNASAARAAQCAALVGLGEAGGVRDLEAILPFLGAPRADVSGAALNALVALKGRRVGRKLQALYAQQPQLARVAILNVLDRRDPEGSRSFIETAVTTDTSEVKALAHTPARFEHESAYLEVARSGGENAKLAAIRKYLDLADQVLGARESDKALGMYHTALDLATENPERIRALGAMAGIADPASMPQLEKLLDDKQLARDLKTPIANCAVCIAEAALDSDPAFAEQVLGYWLNRAPDRDIARRAAAGMRALGHDVDLAARAGFISHWELIGPFALRSFGDSFPPEHTYEPNAAYTGADGRQVTWEKWFVEDPSGVTDLQARFTPSRQVAAYARAVVTVPENCDILVKIGSDDGVVCWLNGKKIHENDIKRGVVVDDDMVSASLRAGENVFLLKIVQGDGAWGFCVRLTDTLGRSIKLNN